VQKLLANPPLLRDLLDGQIRALDRLVEQAMKKRPKPAPEQQTQKACVGV
jgi:hypothetical protein